MSPRCLGAAGSVRARQIAQSASLGEGGPHLTGRPAATPRGPCVSPFPRHCSPWPGSPFPSRCFPRPGSPSPRHFYLRSGPRHAPRPGLQRSEVEAPAPDWLAEQLAPGDLAAQGGTSEALLLGGQSRAGPRPAPQPATDDQVGTGQPGPVQLFVDHRYLTWRGTEAIRRRPLRCRVPGLGERRAAALARQRRHRACHRTGRPRRAVSRARSAPGGGGTSQGQGSRPLARQTAPPPRSWRSASARRRYRCASCSQVKPIPPRTWTQSLALSAAASRASAVAAAAASGCSCGASSAAHAASHASAVDAQPGTAGQRTGA